MPFSPDFTRHVKSAADIVRVIGETVRLKKAGSNYVGLCPFHQEKTPSFSVHPTRQFYYCFGCGAKGDVFRFVMEMEKVPFPDAVKRVAQRAGIPVPADLPTGEMASAEARLRAALEKLHEWAAAFYRQQLESAEAAPLRELIQKRGVAAESAGEFGMGFAPASGNALIRSVKGESVSREVLDASGLFLRRDTGELVDRFRNRWIFPIAAENGKIVAFAGRALGQDQPKYLNSPETALYSKSRVLYNLSRARDAIRKSNQAVLVEGYMDAIAVHQAGVKNVVATCGTSLTESQVRMLARHGSEVVVSYDPDSAGVAATDRSLSLLLEEGLSVRILRLPGALDPDQFIQKEGAGAYQKQLGEAQPFFNYLAKRALELHGKSTPEAKLAALNFVLPFAAKVPNKLIRAELVADIAQRMDVAPGIVMDAFRKAGLDRRDSFEAPADLGRVPAGEAMLIRLLLDSEEAREKVPIFMKENYLLDEMEYGTIVSTLLAMVGSGSEPDLAALSDRLEPGQQRILAQIAFDKDARPVSIEEISAYFSALERKRLERRRVSIQKRILEAQKSSDAGLAMKLLEEQHQLDKLLRNMI